MVKYDQVIAYIIANKSYPAHNMKGEYQFVTVPIDWTELIYELSLLLGKMQVYFDRADTENYGYMEKAFLKKCFENDIDMDEFDRWHDEVKNDQDCTDEQTCETCN
jgi:hypothetical protein